MPSCSTRNSDNRRTVPINEVATARRENASITNASPVPPKLHNIAHKTAKMGISIHGWLLQTSSQGYGTYPVALSRIQSFKENHIQKMSVEDESTCTLFCLLLQESVCIRMNIASEREYSQQLDHTCTLSYSPSTKTIATRGFKKERAPDENIYRILRA